MATAKGSFRCGSGLWEARLPQRPCRVFPMVMVPKEARDDQDGKSWLNWAHCAWLRLHQKGRAPLHLLVPSVPVGWRWGAQRV